jgi:hypothetical protein
MCIDDLTNYRIIETRALVYPNLIAYVKITSNQMINIDRNLSETL